MFGFFVYCCFSGGLELFIEATSNSRSRGYLLVIPTPSIQEQRKVQVHQNSGRMRGSFGPGEPGNRGQLNDELHPTPPHPTHHVPPFGEHTSLD